MARLVVNPGSESTWDIPLNPGSTFLGRSQENTVPIEHESVSSSHREIVVSEAAVWVRDLGSTNGTFIDGELVEQARLRPGQTLRVGEVEMRFEAGEPEYSPGAAGASSTGGQVLTAPEVLAPTKAAVRARCKLHPRTEARFACPKCHQAFCDFCVSTRVTGGRSCKFCRVCGVECTPLDVRPPSTGPAAPRFFASVGRAFVYPMQGDGVILLVVGTIFRSLLNGATFLAAFAGFFGLVAIGFLLIFGTGYVTAYLRRILVSSAMGDEAMPDWPDFRILGATSWPPFSSY